jgi:hypothetical protein
MEKDIISELKTQWNPEKYKQAQKLLLDKLTIISNLETELNKIKDLKTTNINIAFFKEEFKKCSTFEDKVNICEMFIKEFDSH